VEPADQGAILVILSDDGTGFEPDSASGAAGEGRGLANMRRRAVQMGGRLGIESAAGRGTQLTLAIPIAIPADAKPESTILSSDIPERGIVVVTPKWEISSLR
jgi:signal transduction histidine kinase